MLHLLEPDVPLAAWLADRGQPAWRAGTIRRWLFAGRTESFAGMTDLPKGLRDDLARDFTLWTTTIARHHQADDGTEKLLLQLHDGQRIECVMLRDGDRLLSVRIEGDPAPLWATMPAEVAAWRAALDRLGPVPPVARD